MQLTKNFTDDEFKCPCCGGRSIDIILVEKLQVARTIAGIPFGITSGYRCQLHNKAMGSNSQSSHRVGLAADIYVQAPKDRFTIVTSLLEAGFTRIGIGRTYIHVDVDPHGNERLMWVY